MAKLRIITFAAPLIAAVSLMGGVAAAAPAAARTDPRSR